MPLSARDLHVVSVINNPRRWRSRIRLLREFVGHMKEQGVSLTLVDHAFGEREWNIDPADPILDGVNVVRVRGGSGQEIWLKEALINLGVRSLPHEWKYVAWIDADILFQRRDFAIETIHALQHHRVVQPWSHAVDLGPDGAPVENEWGTTLDRGFAAAWVAGDIDEPREGYGIGQKQSRWLIPSKEQKDWRQHYGFAWATRRDVWDGIGGMPDWLITGAADFFMAYAFAGQIPPTSDYTSPGCERRLRSFARKCDEHVRQDIGVVPGLIHHGWHGKKVRRNYMVRKDLIIESGYDPDVDLTYDWQGLPSLMSDNRVLRDGLRRMNTLRNEDSDD